MSYIKEIEQNLIGQVIGYPDKKVLSICLEYIPDPDNFSDEFCRNVYTLFLQMRSKDIAIDLHTTVMFYSKNLKGNLYSNDKVKSFAINLHEISSKAEPPNNVAEHCLILIQEKIKKEIRQIGKEMSDMGDLEDTLEFQEKMQIEMNKISQRIIKGGAIDIVKLTQKGFDELNKKLSGEQHWIRSYYDSLDRIIGGFYCGELTYIAARPSMGKTSFALNLIKNQIDAGKSVLFYSLEMSDLAVHQRFASLYSGINSFSIRQGKLSEEEETAYKNKMSEILNRKLYVDTETNVNLVQLEAKIENEIIKHHPDIIYIDYLKLINFSDSKKSEYENITNISTELKKFAKKINIPMVVIHQLSRKLEDRKDKKPTMSDLRSSGQLEQDGDLIILLHRDDYFDDSREVPDPSICDVIIAKQRNGAIGKIQMNFFKSTSLFTEYSI